MKVLELRTANICSAAIRHDLETPHWLSAEALGKIMVCGNGQTGITRHLVRKAV